MLHPLLESSGIPHFCYRMRLVHLILTYFKISEVALKIQFAECLTQVIACNTGHLERLLFLMANHYARLHVRTFDRRFQ